MSQGHAHPALGRRLRVLLVDDAATVRRTLSDVLGEDPELEVVGTAADGRIALARIPEVDPDLVVLDLEMPVMDGFETLQRLRERWPALPVIVFSAASARGAEASLRALWSGANDCVVKPRGGVAAAGARIHDELIPRIKALCAARTAPGEQPEDAPGAEAGSSDATGAWVRPSLMVIAASTGGPRALATVLGGLPAALPLPVVVVQHMPAEFTRHLAAGLAARVALPVTEAADGETLVPGRVWVAPGGHHLRLRTEGARVRVQLDAGPPENGCRPSADPALRSAAAIYGPALLAVILTGMGRDGLAGCAAVTAAGGQVVAQDRESSVVWGMPGAVADAGLAGAVLPLERIAGEVLRRVRTGRTSRRAA